MILAMTQSVKHLRPLDRGAFLVLGLVGCGGLAAVGAVGAVSLLLLYVVAVQHP